MMFLVGSEVVTTATQQPLLDATTPKGPSSALKAFKTVFSPTKSPSKKDQASDSVIPPVADPATRPETRATRSTVRSVPVVELTTLRQSVERQYQQVPKKTEIASPAEASSS